MAQFDALIVPTSPTIHTLAEMEQSPNSQNSEFGTYTNFYQPRLFKCPRPARGFPHATVQPFGISLIAPAMV